ncbi:MAG TPA: glycosyltransferase [Actinomadura sp.]|jgi:hypothetical protein|nr:glycosyltransferase [Actinomadura sp.]
MQAEADVAVIIAAKDERDRITATVKAALELPGVDLVVVVDDGSADATGRLAREAGATVVRHSRNRGKGTAMETGAEAVRLLDQDGSRRRAALPGRGGDLPAEAGEPPRHLLFLDADLADTARAAAPLIEPVRRGDADMTIAAFSSTVKLGGHGLVVRLSRDGIKRATGWEATQPLNGQRCLTRAAFEAALPLATGFGVETALTIDLLHRGFRVVEVEVPLAHRATGTDLKAQLHRARQLRDVARALAVREPSVARGLRRFRGLR